MKIMLSLVILVRSAKCMKNIYSQEEHIEIESKEHLFQNLKEIISLHENSLEEIRLIVRKMTEKFNAMEEEYFIFKRFIDSLEKNLCNFSCPTNIEVFDKILNQTHITEASKITTYFRQPVNWVLAKIKIITHETLRENKDSSLLLFFKTALQRVAIFCSKLLNRAKSVDNDSYKMIVFLYILPVLKYLVSIVNLLYFQLYEWEMDLFQFYMTGIVVISIYSLIFPFEIQIETTSSSSKKLRKKLKKKKS